MRMKTASEETTSQRSLVNETNEHAELCVATTSQYIYVPAKTADYIIIKGSKGLALLANRSICEGETIFQNSIQFTLSDVQDGDRCLFHISKLFSGPTKETFYTVPTTTKITKDMLLSHGIPVLSDDPSGKSLGIISYHLQIPTMFMNHSSDPNVIQDGGKEGHKHHIALRNISKGDELNIDYSLLYYDGGPTLQNCLCGSSNCTKKILGFKHLEEDKQKDLLPVVSNAVRAMFMADSSSSGIRSLVYEQPLFVKRTVQAPKKSLLSAERVMRMVCPSPTTFSDVGIRIDSNNNVLGLYSLRAFEKGEVVYKFWVDDWPMKGRIPIEMVFSTAMGVGDPMEGTSIRLEPNVHGYKDSRGVVKFSFFNSIIEHSCDPNVVYKETKQNEKNRVHFAYAAHHIPKGQILTSDMNSRHWARDGLNIVTCTCRADECVGTVKGFKFLPNIRQKKKWIECDNGRHLSPIVREEFKKIDSYYDELFDYDSARQIHRNGEETRNPHEGLRDGAAGARYAFAHTHPRNAGSSRPGVTWSSSTTTMSSRSIMTPKSARRPYARRSGLL